MSIKDKLSFKRYPVTYLSIFFLSFIALFLVFNRFFFAPKILLLCVIILVAVSLGKLQIVAKDWFVFLSFVYLCDTLRGSIYALTCELGLPVHTLYVIKAEKFLFGGIPSVTLQKLLLKNVESLDFGWLEKILTTVHGTHFVAFLFIGLAIWLQKPKYFPAFKTSFYVITCFGMMFYFAIPTVPPWMASNLFGVIPEISRFNILIYNMSIPDITSGFNTNPIAAMPSLHAAFPVLSALILWQVYRWKAAAFYVYTLIMLFTIVYTGDHYIVDVLAGVLLAIPCYAFVFRKKIVRDEEAERIGLHTSSGRPILWKKYGYLIVGTLLLGIGIPLGISNKIKFEGRPDSYDYTAAPKYIDFLNHENRYQDSYRIQLYFGKHYLAQKEYDRALYHLLQATQLSQDIMEKKKVSMKIKQVEALLNRKKQLNPK
jgi:membrane-associated phospholipid phosphatase